MAASSTLAEVDGGPLVAPSSLFAHIQQGLNKNPYGPAVISLQQGPADVFSLGPVKTQYDTNGVTKFPECMVLTYTQIHVAALKLVAGLTGNRVRAGSTILMLIPNGGEYCVLLWACVVMRLTFVCLDPSLLSGASRRSELSYILETTKPSTIVVQGANDAKTLRTIIQDNVFLLKVLVISLSSSDDLPEGTRSLAEIVCDSSGYELDEDVVLETVNHDDREQLFSVMFTSGTSGRPKGCPLRVRNISNILQSQSWLINSTNCSRVLQQAHNSRAIAPFQTLQTWKAGGAVVMTGRGLRVDDTADAITRHGATFVVLTPHMVLSLSRELATRLRPTTTVSVRRVQIGGDAVTKDVLIECASLFPHADVCINHGMTEGAGAFKWPFFGTPTREIPYFGQICPVGTVAPGAVVRIWNAEGRAVAKRGTPGELHIRCGSIISHYVGGASADSFYEDATSRWFVTGDIAMIDSSSVVFILGRSKDMIKRNGVAIMPAVIESCIKEFTESEVCPHELQHRFLQLK